LIIGSNFRGGSDPDVRYDKLFGGAGNDIIQAGNSGTFIDGGDGHDVIAGGQGWDDIYGGRGHDVIDGGRGSDLINGGAGNDFLIDIAEDGVTNRIEGGIGHDTTNLASDPEGGVHIHGSTERTLDSITAGNMDEWINMLDINPENQADAEELIRLLQEGSLDMVSEKLRDLFGSYLATAEEGFISGESQTLPEIDPLAEGGEEEEGEEVEA
jgi:hypothetical protein